MEHKAPDCSKGKSNGKGDIVCDNCGMKADQRAESLMKGNGKGRCQKAPTALMIKYPGRQESFS